VQKLAELCDTEVQLGHVTKLLRDRPHEPRLVFAATWFGRASQQVKIAYLMASLERFDHLAFWSKNDDANGLRLFADPDGKCQGTPVDLFVSGAKLLSGVPGALAHVKNPIAKNLIMDHAKLQDLPALAALQPFLSPLFAELALHKLGVALPAEKPPDLTSLPVDSMLEPQLEALKGLLKFCNWKVPRECNPAHSWLYHANEEVKRIAAAAVTAATPAAATAATPSAATAGTPAATTAGDGIAEPGIQEGDMITVQAVKHRELFENKEFTVTKVMKNAVRIRLESGETKDINMAKVTLKKRAAETAELASPAGTKQRSCAAASSALTSTRSLADIFNQQLDCE
jgi:hypothetical protein